MAGRSATKENKRATRAKPRDPFEVVADIFDPPQWVSPSHPTLEPHQQPPPGVPGKDWKLWLLEGGRGCGKTEACSHYFAKYMHRNAGARGRIIAPTYDDAVASCIEGPSGLLNVDPDVRWVPSSPGGGKVLWPNGSEALVRGCDKPRDVERLRAGGNRHIDWWEEMAANPQLKDAWDQAAFGLRLGEAPHSIGSTTPRSIDAYRAIRKMPGTVRTHATILDNPNLNDSWKQDMIKKYEGTRLGRQELQGELIEDVEGALWNRKMIEACRVWDCPELAIAGVAVDPAASESSTADDTGIIGGGIGATNGHGYITDDKTCHLSPDGWGKRTVRLWEKLKADFVIGERNNGGDMVEYVIATADWRVPYESVWASRGKQTRAQPVAALFGNPPKRESRIHIVGSMPQLEDQLCNWVPGEEDSPDRLDAMVWLITKLMLEEEEVDTIIEEYEPVQIGANI